ncbi:DUF262 domain-containing protein [Leptolyngbya sp. FACHB-541]|uniref:DUF262 domain-containing protein n=1 Tax=Leptolyngbya sp. FACHB-541 TaxID=2692810 RepID=UPI0016831189|nr:DUF262 domain-containing protein [Leptolyngbya sp. FACHB-541]MBD2000772.1 DUF262 domain-containing protein [Leptolyngbya sp. FACHB-541]
MKIEANDKEVRDIFSLGYFKIPRFQRPYSWTEEEIKNFWEDVVIGEYEHYFIGSMVVYQTEKPYYGIVDGQQRLTTITLILAAIRNAFVEYDERNLALGIHNYIEKANIDNINEFVLNAESSFPYFQNYIQSFKSEKINCIVGNEELNLKIAFEIINKNLYSIIPRNDRESIQADLLSERKLGIIEKLKEIRNKILSLKLVFIQLDNEDDAYLIFETLNTRGKELTTSDLVKNLLLKKLKSNNASLDHSKVIWNTILERFDNYGVEDIMEVFLYHYWLSKYGDVTQQKLFGEVKGYVSSASKAHSLLYDLQENSDYYTSIVSPENYPWTKEESEIKECLQAFQLFNVKQQTPMLLSLVRAYRDKKLSLRVLRQILSKIESFHFIFNAITSQRSSGSIASLYSKHAQELSNADNADKIQSINTSLTRKLKSKLPSFDEFEVGFSSLIFTKNKTRHKKIIQYILSRFMGKNINGLPIDYKFVSIEHLLPQSRGDEEIVGSIGNLILVDKETNNVDLRDFDFLQKISILQSKKYPIDADLLKSQWTEKEIKERTKSMSLKAYCELWNIT